MATLIDDLRMVIDESVRRGVRPEVIRIKMKERLQLYVLDFIYNNPRYNYLIFYGGTCLRKCFGTGRMSEDIDCETSEGFAKEKFAHDVARHFKERVVFKEMLVRASGRGVDRIELRFPVLNALGLSPLPEEMLNVKVEVNAIGKKYPTETKTISEERFSFVVRHYDLPTMMAGKMLACLERVWVKGTTGVRVKGRDYFDLLWYMRNLVMPNRERLSDSRGKYTARSAFEQLAERVENIKGTDLLLDLESLFEEGNFAKNWVAHFRDEFARLYERYSQTLKWR